MPIMEFDLEPLACRRRGRVRRTAPRFGAGDERSRDRILIGEDDRANSAACAQAAADARGSNRKNKNSQTDSA